MARCVGVMEVIVELSLEVEEALRTSSTQASIDWLCSVWFGYSVRGW